jgi:N-acetylglucosamine-6-phosphate deacetylase
MNSGFVDLQVNGYKGVNFSTNEWSKGDFAEAFRGILATGTVAFLPTVVTSSVELYERNLPMLAALLDEPEFQGRVLGLHVEGPFISPEPGAVGNHRADCVKDPDPDFLERLQEWSQGKIKIFTLAAERPGSSEVCEKAVQMGITVSLGHQLALDPDIELLAKSGATLLTHLGNGIPSVLPRLSNPIWSGLAEDRLTAMIIADGHHLPRSVLKTIIRAKGIERIVVTSDAAFLAGMPPGTYRDTGHEVVLESTGRIWNPAAKCLAGSSAMMIDCMNHLASLEFLELDDLLRVGVENPLRVIQVDPASVDLGPIFDFSTEKGFFRPSQAVDR